MPPHRILYTTTTPIAALAFFAAQLRHLRRQGHDVHLVTPPEPAELVARARVKNENTPPASLFHRRCVLPLSYAALQVWKRLYESPARGEGE